MLIQVLGTGCAKCTKLAVQTEEAAKQMGIEYTLEKVGDIMKIMSFDVMVTPALVLDGKLQCTGTVPSVAEIKTMIQKVEES
jgi:small redox-active disulfide protein 2